MQFTKTFPLGILALSLALSSQQTRADVRYTTNMSMAGMDAAMSDTPGAKAPAFVTTTFIKDMRERVERSMQMGPIQSNSITITMCDKHQQVTLLPSAKVYMVEPIGVISFTPPQTGRPGTAPGSMEMPGGTPGKGHVVTTISVQDIGMEKVAEINAHHVIMNVHIQTSGCIGTGDTTMKMEQWIAPIKASLNCPERFSPSRVVPNEKGCQITYDIKGDFAKMRTLYDGMVVKQIIYSPNDPTKPLATQDLRDYSLAALDDSLFSVPADFKEVSADEYHRDEQQAMMKAMMSGGIPGMSTDTPPADTTPDAQPGDTPPTTPPQDNSKKKRPKFHIPGLPF